ncbi:MAG: hypothetical protein Q7U54_03620 [Bacteroidales bacterium]|nr:hypothetical protein [Bacteroidales bacterium]
MRKFIKWVLIFSLPLIIWFILVVLVDPYNYFSYGPKIIDNRLKMGISYKLNRPLFQLLAFKNHPTPSILLGDSRTACLKSEIINKYTKNDFTNLAYAGGSLVDAINTFWLVSKDNKLSDVYIGINFSLFNKYRRLDMVTEDEKLINNFFLYALNESVFKSTYLILKSLITGKEIQIGVPASSKGKFWIFQLNTIANEQYGLYEYPSNYYTELTEISKYCKKNGINLVFFIPPTHTDLQKKVKQFNLQNFDKKFKNDLEKIGDLYDFDYPSDMTNNYNNFHDPYHFTDSIGEIVVRELFAKETDTYVRFKKAL